MKQPPLPPSVATARSEFDVRTALRLVIRDLTAIEGIDDTN